MQSTQTMIRNIMSRLYYKSNWSQSKDSSFSTDLLSSFGNFQNLSNRWHFTVVARSLITNAKWNFENKSIFIKMISQAWKGDGKYTEKCWLAKDPDTFPTAEVLPWCQSTRTSHPSPSQMTSGLCGTHSNQVEDWKRGSKILAFTERFLSVQGYQLV